MTVTDYRLEERNGRYSQSQVGKNPAKSPFSPLRISSCSVLYFIEETSKNIDCLCSWTPHKYGWLYKSFWFRAQIFNWDWCLTKLLHLSRENRILLTKVLIPHLRFLTRWTSIPAGFFQSKQRGDLWTDAEDKCLGPITRGLFHSFYNYKSIQASFQNIPAVDVSISTPRRCWGSQGRWKCHNFYISKHRN